MSKFALVVALAILAVAQGYPQGRDSDISEAASRGDWDEVHKLIQQHFESQRSLWENGRYPSDSASSVKYLKPPPGGHVHAEAVYTFKTSQNKNGKKVENKGGHRIVNEDGVIKEYDIEP